jgi:hypothetical protein
MPSRHGAILQGKDGPQCKLGIQQIFDPWIAPELLLAQGHNIRHPEGRPLDIHLHFRRVVIRLLRSLGRFYQGARQYDQFLEAGALAGPNPGLVFEIPEEAGIAADSIFHYLTLFIDDLARMIPFVLIEDGDERQEPDGFNAVKWQVTEGQLPASQNVRDLFMALDQDDSWWSLGFRRGIGMRQRLMHYTDLVYFSASTKTGDTKMTSDISLIRIGGQVEGIELEDALQNLLSGLCEWLDQLDQELLSHLAERLERQGVHWEPFNDAVPVFRLPGPGEAPLDASHYLYLPICGEAPPATDDSTTTER